MRRRADTILPLPDHDWRDVLTGASHADAQPPLAELTRRLPVALLIPERFYIAETGRLADGSGQ